MIIIERKKTPPINLCEDDTIELTYNEKVLMKRDIGKYMVINEILIFGVEAGDFGENVVDGIGGAFLQTNR